jgi:hypothetical protein
MLSVVMLSVGMLPVVKLSVMAPFKRDKDSNSTSAQQTLCHNKLVCFTPESVYTLA